MNLLAVSELVRIRCEEMQAEAEVARWVRIARRARAGRPAGRRDAGRTRTAAPVSTTEGERPRAAV